jgi:methylenetetrahydrofolate dehydrogenase (NADP+)/methenyltetrahydrofolate cyclohydrolase
VILGRSNIVGKPLSIMLSASSPDANATVTLCHTGTKDLPEITRGADFLFSAMGKPGYITASMVKEGAVIVDAGITRTPHGLSGDCDFQAVSKVASAITPVPGGVGPMTIAQLLTNTVQAFRDFITAPDSTYKIVSQGEQKTLPDCII